MSEQSRERIERSIAELDAGLGTVYLSEEEFLASLETKRVVLRPKGQVTVPAGLCRLLGWEPGDVLEASEEMGSIVLKRVAQGETAP